MDNVLGGRSGRSRRAIAGSAALLAIVSLAPRLAGAASITSFSEWGFVGAVTLEVTGGIPANAELELNGAPQDPVSFVFSISLAAESAVLLGVAIRTASSFSQPTPLAMGWLPGDGDPASEPDSLTDVVDYSTGIAFGTALDWAGNFSGGLYPGDTSNRFFVAYERSVAEPIDSFYLPLFGVGFDPYPPRVVVAVPEPSSLLLLAAGLALLRLPARRRARSR